MTNSNDIPKGTVIVRWLALASATGAALTSAISLWLNDSVWLNFSIISSFLTVSFVAALWNRINVHSKILEQTEQSTQLHIQELNNLQFELEKHKTFERELRTSKIAAESAALSKSEFLATMSHEIRTPLNGVIPMLDLLATSKLEVDQAEILSTARSSANQMKQIVDDILDYSKLEANKLKLETTGLNIREVVFSVVQMFTSQAEAKRISINVNLDPSLRLALRGDPVRLRQILSNILSNAIKFTGKGSITISIRAKSETRQHHILRFEVKDSGIGISPENASRLFKPFSQADASTTRIYGGTGLGLVICKRIVDLMSGQIGVDSQPDIGSTFWFEIPMLKAIGDSHGMASELKNANVLLFTTDQSLCNKFEQSDNMRETKLSITGTAIETQKTLSESVAIGSASDFDLLIIDVNSGRQSALQLQKMLLSNSDFERMRIALLLSADSPPLDIGKNSRCRIISRNLDSSLLFNELSKLLSVTALNIQLPIRIDQEPFVNIQPPDMLLAAGQSRGMVLLVEDNPVNLLVAQRLIQLSSFDFVSAENGEVALELLQQQSFDMVLMDCQMPVMDGYSATQAWRAIEKSKGLAHMPIIAMTANAMAEDRQKCLDAGMDDYLSKPVDRKLLQQIMMKWLKKETVKNLSAKKTRVTEQTTDNQTTKKNELVSSSLDNDIVKDLQELMGSDYQSLIRIYLEDSPKLISQLLSALQNKDSMALISPSHTLKSSSANLGAINLSKIAMRIERSARTGDIDLPLREKDALLEEFEKVKTALSKIIA
jgi:signal transduction histidine kinase/CheY-like chemotaxis protein/HPt (histidine-containing phosphotransfer) domain-containing protein